VPQTAGLRDAEITFQISRVHDPSAGKNLAPARYAQLSHDVWQIVIEQNAESFLKLSGGTEIRLSGKDSDPIQSLDRMFSGTEFGAALPIPARQGKLGYVLAQIPEAISAAMQSDTFRSARNEVSAVANGFLAADTILLAGETADQERVTVQLRLTEKGRIKLRQAITK
jgi:hypothetical protein